MECLEARRSTQLTEGELSLKSATFFSPRLGQTDSITSHNSRRPAISRSEMDRVQFGKGCKFRKNHPGRGDLPDAYTSSVVSKLKDAVGYVMASKESPAKKMKVEIIA